ncbi:MAG: threonine ammonia-lyase [Bosea sp. (in: a-proteobacteria)]
MIFDVSLDDIRAAESCIAGKVRETPAYASADVSARLGAAVVLKLECLQQAGSFKVRGCFNKLLSMSSAERARGVVTVSGGNHAIAVSQVATSLGAKALVLMPKTVAPFNVALTRAAGGEVELCEDAIAAFAKADEYAAQGRTNVHSYDDPLIIAGHGTLGLEFARQAQGLTHLFISIGGGGFAAGVGAAMKGLNPALHIIGVETEGATTMTEALAAGKPVAMRPTSIARTLGAPFATERTMAAARAFLDEIVVVPDRDAVSELVWLLQNERVLVEPAAACVLAAAMARRDTLGQNARVGLILCGSNVALEDVAGWRAGFGL